MVHLGGSRAVVVLYVLLVGFIAVFSKLLRSACSALQRTCCERCFMCNSFLGLCLLLQKVGRSTFRVLLAPLGFAKKNGEELALCLCFISVHQGLGEGGLSRVRENALKQINKVAAQLYC